jgi:hypothetical protein
MNADHYKGKGNLFFGWRHLPSLQHIRGIMNKTRKSLPTNVLIVRGDNVHRHQDIVSIVEMPANVLPVELAFGVNLITFGKDFSSATSVFIILPFFP